MAERESPYGLVWDEYTGSGVQQRVIRKEQGVRNFRQFSALLHEVSRRPRLVTLIGSWHPDGEYTLEETSQFIVSE